MPRVVAPSPRSRRPAAALPFLILPLLLVRGLGSPARAQTINYGGFEQMFGEPVTASATGTPQRPGDVPANMEIITAEEIRRSGAANIPDVLKHVTGMDVLRWGTTSADVAVRSYNTPYASRLLVLINGRSVYLDDFERAQ